jgi:hypothetical protein
LFEVPELTWRACIKLNNGVSLRGISTALMVSDEKHPLDFSWTVIRHLTFDEYGDSGRCVFRSGCASSNWRNWSSDGIAGTPDTSIGCYDISRRQLSYNVTARRTRWTANCRRSRTINLGDDGSRLRWCRLPGVPAEASWKRIDNLSLTRTTSPTAKAAPHQ